VYRPARRLNDETCARFPFFLKKKGKSRYNTRGAITTRPLIHAAHAVREKEEDAPA
jgi:hypothetical protein